MYKAPPSVTDVIRNCLRRQCPRCGQSALLGRWLRIRAGCDACDLCFEQRAGDTWAFWILIERVFLGVILLVVVLGFRSRGWTPLLLFGGGCFAVFFATMPHRLALCLGFDYLSRRWTGDLADEAPTDR